MAFRPATAIGSGKGGSGKPKTSSIGVQGSAPGAAPAGTYTAPIGSKSEQQARYEETVQTIQSAQGGSSKEASVQARALEAQNQYAVGSQNKAVIEVARQERNETVRALSGDPRTEVLQTVSATKTPLTQPKGLSQSLDSRAFGTVGFGGVQTTQSTKTDNAFGITSVPFLHSVLAKDINSKIQNIIQKPYSSFSPTQKLDIKAEELKIQGGYIGKGISRETAGKAVSFVSGVAGTTPKEAGIAIASGAAIAGTASLLVAGGVVSAPVVATVGTVVTVLGAGAIGFQALKGDYKGAGKSTTEFALFGLGAKGAGKVIEAGAKVSALFGGSLKTSVTGFQDSGIGFTTGRVSGLKVSGVTTTTSAGKVTQSQIKVGSDKTLDITTQRVKVPSADVKQGIPEYITVSKVTAMKAGKPIGEKVVLGERPADIYAREKLTTTKPAENQVSLYGEGKLNVLEARPSPNVVTETTVKFSGSKSSVTTKDPNALLFKGTVTNVEGTARVKTEYLEPKEVTASYDIYTSSRQQQLPKGKSILPTVRQEFKETAVGYEKTPLNNLISITTPDRLPLKSTSRYVTSTVTQKTTTTVNKLEVQALATPLLVQGGLGTGVNIGSASFFRTGRIKLTEPKIKTIGESKLKRSPENPTSRAYPELKTVQAGIKMFEPRVPKFSAGFSPSLFTGSDSTREPYTTPKDLSITGTTLKQEPTVTPKTKTDITTKQTPDVTTVTKTVYTPTPFIPSTPSGSSFFSSPPSSPNVNVPPVIFPPFVTTPSGGLGSGKKFSFSSGKQKTKYTPTAFAVAFNIRGKESKGLSKTGLSIRPIQESKGLKNKYAIQY